MSTNGNPNNDDEAATTDEASATQPRAQMVEPSRNRKRRRKPLQAFWSIGLLLAMVAIGGVVWKVLPHSSSPDDGDDIAEIDGFESDPTDSESQSLGAPVPDDLMASNSQNRATIELPPLTNETAIPPRNAHSSTVAVGTRSSANAWLTGTIEDADVTDSIRVPERLSGGPVDGTTLR